MHRIWYHAIVFLIRPTPTHDNTLQVILKTSIFRFADPNNGSEKLYLDTILFPDGEHFFSPKMFWKPLWFKSYVGTTVADIKWNLDRQTAFY